MDKQNSIRTTLAKKFFQKAGCRSMSENDLKFHFFSKISFSSNYCIGHVECSYDFHLERISTIGPHCSTECPKTFEKKVLKKTLPESDILDAEKEKSSEDPGDSFCHEAEKFSLNFRKRRKKFLSNKKECSKNCYGHVVCSFEYLAEKHSTAGQNFFAQCRKF